MLTDAHRPAAFFIADHVALDFLNSVGAPWGEEIEWLETPEDLLAWMVEAALLSKEKAAHYEKTIEDAHLKSVVKDVRDLREWFRGFVTKHFGPLTEPLTENDIAPLNQILSKGRYRREICLGADKEGDDALLHWRWLETSQNGAEDLLLLLAEAMGDLICEADLKLVKNCEGPTCTMWFLDISKNHSRRWCTMSVCGNRAKAAAFRARKAGKD